MPRQPLERRRRPGGTEHEPDVRLGRTGGPRMTLVVKLGGAALDNPALVGECAAALAELARSGHRLAVVHG
ncbi:MAG: hypothetical protein ACRD4D_07610, partial [Candidatus Acidiferrales bacterium]